MKTRALLIALAAAALSSATAVQAQVTSAQQSALRSNCRSDFMSHCSGVTPGGKDALTCLQKNVDKLSGGCQTVVRGTMPAPAAAAAPPPPPAPAAAAAPPPPPPPAPAAAAAPPPPPPAAAPPPAPPKVKVAAPPPAAIRPAAPKPAAAAAAAPTAAQQSAMRANCRNDFMAKCAGVQPGGKEALSCLQGHVTTLSASCKKVVASTMGAPMAAPPPAATAAAMPPAPAPAAPAAGPDPAKLKALKFTCRGDFRRLCKNVPEGPQALACLQANSAKLSPNCRTSVADVESSIPDGAAMPAPTPAAVKPAPVPHPPKAPVIDAAAMIRGCKLDMVRHCRGVGVGDGKMIACLTAHEADLTIRCRTLFKLTKPLH
jgi:hypothetical protein